LHVVPRFKPSEFISESGLADCNGFLNLDINTLQHKKYKNIWGLGDCAALPTSKTSAAIYD
jgi:sulfide:quinone oxidoreductase